MICFFIALLPEDFLVNPFSPVFTAVRGEQLTEEDSEKALYVEVQTWEVGTS